MSFGSGGRRAIVNSPICVDASVVIRLVTGHAHSETVRDRVAHWIATGRRLVAPALFGFEVANGLHRYSVAGELTHDEVREAMAAAMALGIELDRSPTLHARALAIAERLAMPAVYDAHYLATAEAEGAELHTFDGRLAGWAEAMGVACVRFDASTGA